MKRINKRKDVSIVDTNVTLLSLGEAVRRWTADGQFLMTEVNASDSYESKDANIPRGSYSERISKIEAALAGLDFVKEVQASSTSEVTTPPSSEVTTPPAAE